MRAVVLALSFLVALASATPVRASTPVVGQSVIYRYDSTHSYPAIVTYVYGDGEADLVILNSYAVGGYSFHFGPSSRWDWPATYLDDVSEGVSDNRWRVNPDIALITGTSTPSLTIGGSAAQFSTFRDVEYTAVVKIAVAITLTTGAAGHVDLVCDSSATPTTIRETASTELTGTLVVGANLVHSSTHVLRWRVQAGDYCKLTSTNDTGTPTYTLVRQFAQTLGM